MASNFLVSDSCTWIFAALEIFLLMSSSVLFTGINKVSALGRLGKKCRVSVVSVSKLMVFNNLILLSFCFNTEAY